MKLLKTIQSNVLHKKEGKKRRMVVIRKRQITAFSLLILVGVAGYLNWSFQKDAVDPDVAAVYSEVTKKLGEAQMVSGTAQEVPDNHPTPVVNDYFAQAKLERDVRRSESMDMLAKILDSPETDKEARSRAEDEIHYLADITEKEVLIENLIKAKGYDDVVTMMGENLISIAVKSQLLNEVDAAIIKDIAVSVTGYSAETVKLIEIQS